MTVYIGDALVGTVAYQEGTDIYDFFVSRRGEVVTLRGGSDTVTIAEVEVYGFGRSSVLSWENPQTAAAAVH